MTPQSSPQAATSAHTTAHPQLARRLGLFDATMIVMGGIIGSGIFINPYVVATHVHTPALILGAWAAGGVIALMGAFIYAELAAHMPAAGGQYAYLREAYHPLVAFLYGWVLLLVVQTGGMAAVSVTFANYLLEITGWHARPSLVAAIALGILTVINCLGVRQGSGVQSALMVTKIAALAALIVLGWGWTHPAAAVSVPPRSNAGAWAQLSAFGAAMVPVMFAYGGWQTANFVAGEMRNPRRDLPRGLLIGVLGVVTLYVGVSFVCVRALGPEGLAATHTPASAVMRLAFGQRGATFIAFAISISALGFLSQSILTAPRVYFAMAEDGVIFRSIAWVSERTRVPVVAIVLQSVWTIAIALFTAYEKILAYVIAMDLLFIGLSATTIFFFRRRSGTDPAVALARTPGHPVTTIAFIAACWMVVANSIVRFPADTLKGMGLLLLGVPVYFLWRAFGAKR